MTLAAVADRNDAGTAEVGGRRAVLAARGKGRTVKVVAADASAAVPGRGPGARVGGWMRALMRVSLPPLAGLVLLIGLWHLATMNGGGIPTPAKTWDAAVAIFADPFYRAGPNDQGIGWNVLASLQRVAIGFGIAALVGIPAGFLLGRFAVLSQMMNPIISLLRPVSPLAWLPIGLLVFQRADPAATWTIFICSIWPMILNTAQGVTRVPQDYLNVARVLKLSEWKVFTKILFPAVLPYMLTGIRLSIGTAWLVIVAAEMLTGGVGVGFWVWDEWNNLKVEHIIIAIFVIGIVGLILEQALMLVARRFNYENR
ncbi:nitrate/nitrite transport system permease protein [Aromatoleum tolulyticum]|uniref:Nitrate/nitrite transport system permease protein n=1 Tax=Aromatoleum tolulyticum TaxID=34027 RepID=A0A1N6SVD6_9RHOO|nr:nitrate ABC transporter permease [Aromatoleum tolulyticum]SIQ44836.1 nitrate/nitrite transport system permease protein [Aromatoleum tolulyticum]